jgi:hypothetical protein
MFNVTLSLSQVIKVYGEALRILGAITTVVREFLALSPQIGSTRKSSPSRCCTRSSLVMHTISLSISTCCKDGPASITRFTGSLQIF